MSDRIFTVGRLNQYVKSIFDAEDLLYSIRVQGEVSGFKISREHAYFSLKDESAQISCVLFNFKGSPLKDGDQVTALGTVKFYAARGSVSFNVTSVEQNGTGDFYRNFLLLKEKLDKEELFDRKISAPSDIRRIGVITSLTGAVIHDIIRVATRRDPSVDVVLLPVKVQGQGAAEEIARAVRMMDQYKKVDAIIVGRGGGSMEDLAPFNDESVARAVADCKKFIVSAVGHETDFSLCDFCSDLRAPTPSAAAELLTTDVKQKRLQVLHLLNRLIGMIENQQQMATRQLKDNVFVLQDVTRERLQTGTVETVKRIMRLKYAQSTMIASTERIINEKLQRLSVDNPAELLRKGYCAITDSAGYKISSVRAVSAGQSISVNFADGVAKATVQQVRIKEKI